MPTKGFQEHISGYKSTITGWGTLNGLVIRDLLERSNEVPDGEKDPLVQLQELREKITELRVEVQQEEMKSTEVRQLVGT